MDKRLCMWMVAVGLAVSGCGGDDGGGGGAEPDSGMTGTGGTGSGGTGTGGTGGTGGMTATSIPCGTNTCTDPLAGMMLPIPLPMPCCLDEAAGTCGMMMAGGACMEPPESDPRCPMVTAPFPGIVITSCCTDMGLCGLDAALLGMGCVDFATVASGGFGMILAVPGETVCDPTLVGTDAGAEDAGN